LITMLTDVRRRACLSPDTPLALILSGVKSWKTEGNLRLSPPRST
jgi:hypothetical protein